MQHPEPLIKRWLALLNIPVSQRYLENQLRAHPHYPSLLSISDTLSQLGIENNAVQVKRKDFNDLPVPCLAWLQGDSYEFVLVTDHTAALQQVPHFLARWSGIALIASRPDDWHHAENNRLLQHERWQLTARVLFFTIMAFFTGWACLVSAAWSTALLLLTAAAGVFISGLIITKELGIENRIADLICSTGSACDGGKSTPGLPVHTPSWKRWSNAGIIYFTTQWLVLQLTQWSGNAISLLPLMSLVAAASIAFTFFSLYYQCRIKKAFCRLCMIVIVLLWGQFVLLLPAFPLQGITGFQQWWLPAFMVVLITATWLSLRPLLEKYYTLKKEHYDHLRFRNDVNVFATLLEQQHQVSIDNSPANILLGDATAPVRILLVSSPYCKVCAHTHNILHQLTAQYESRVCLWERFALDVEEGDVINATAVHYLYQHLRHHQNQNDSDTVEYNRQVLHDWFAWMDLAVFKEHYPNPVHTNMAPLMNTSRTWCRENHLTSVPKIFINGYELPKPYTVADLHWFIEQPEKLPPPNGMPTSGTYSMNDLTATIASNS